MGKNHRHKKNVKADKAKTQLKQTKTKFLPKGLNVTNTSFKIKPIVLLQQLREQQQDVPLSKRKLNVKDLLTRIKHYNDNVRYAACEELSEMMKIHSEEIITKHLGQVILDISTLMQDRERKVRKSAVKAIEIILEMTETEKIEPFYNYFSTNLRCAMTNIDRNVQEDSLLFLDNFLKHNSNLISINAEKLLPDFFMLISKIRNDSSLNRTLTVNLNSKMTSVTWRIRVLSRLHAVLESILQTANVPVKTNHIVDVHMADESSIFPIYKSSFCNFLENADMSIFNYSSDTISKVDYLNKYIKTLVPLLYETFLEVVPEKKIQKSAQEYTALNEEATAVLSCVMSTLYLLWKYTQQFGSSLDVKDVFLSKEGKKFLNHLLENFPYCKSETQAKKKLGSLKVLDITTDNKCTKENILICYIYSVLNVLTLRRYVKTELDVIVSFIGKTLLTKRCNRPDVLQSLIDILKLFLTHNSQEWKRAGVDMKLILKNTISFYNNPYNEIHRMELFDLLLQILNTSLNGFPQYKEWLSSLPKILCQSRATDIEVDALLKLSRTNNETFHKALLEDLPNILDNLQDMKIVINNPSVLVCEENVKRNIANIFFFVPVLTEYQFRIIQGFLAKIPQSTYQQYFMQMIRLREQL